MLTTRTSLLVAAIVFGALYIAGTVGVPMLPEAGASGEEVKQWFVDHGDAARTCAWLLLLAIIPLGLILIELGARLGPGLRALLLLAAAVFISTTTVYMWFIAGLSFTADQLAPDTAEALLDIARFWGPFLTGTVVLLVLPVTVASLRDGALPRWLGWIGAVLIAEQLVETITVMGDDGFTAPGGDMNILLGGCLFIVWFVAVIVALVRTERPAA
jgi:hypothetical protein